MLKTLSLMPEGDNDVEDDNNNSESRMMRALEALGQPQHGEPQQQAPREELTFRNNRPQRDGNRDQSRDQAAMHQARGRHRFVKDGEVPVVHMAANRPRDAAPVSGSRDSDYARLQQTAEEQRQRADQADRAKADALLQLKLLQTKFAHAEMAASDASAVAEARLKEIMQLQEQLRALQAQHPVPPPAPILHIAAQREADEAAFERDTLFVMPPHTAPVRKIRARIVAPAQPATLLDDEPEPVQWWLAPVKTSAKRPRR